MLGKQLQAQQQHRSCPSHTRTNVRVQRRRMVSCQAAANGSSQPRRATNDDKKHLIDSVDCFIFDCDGVIWRGDSVIDGVPETLDMLRAKVNMLSSQPIT
eukprot:GHUV01016912.1.p2 GENE.GHUV01016912.1~~GHUV01016912.1.p2  ORF type:complete len:100 (+),score=16.90 GHUV01016912.1:150-449(+)